MGVEIPAAPPAATEVVDKNGALEVSTPTDGITTQVARPAWLPEGFDSPEAFAEAYKTLKATPAPKVEPAKTPVLTITTPEQAHAAATQAGVDLNALSAEFLASGELSEESLKVLETKGISRTVIDSYIEGQQAAASVYQTQLADHVGGLEVLQTMLDWAATGLTEAEVLDYNATIAEGKPARAKMALDSLKVRFERENGELPNRVTGEARPNTAGNAPFASQQEVTKAMKDPRYGHDRAYTDKVIARLSTTGFTKVAVH